MCVCVFFYLEYGYDYCAEAAVLFPKLKKNDNNGPRSETIIKKTFQTDFS